MARDKVKEIRELILERYDKNFDGRLEINEVCECSFFFFFLSRISKQISKEIKAKRETTTRRRREVHL